MCINRPVGAGVFGNKKKDKPKNNSEADKTKQETASGEGDGGDASAKPVKTKPVEATVPTPTENVSSDESPTRPPAIVEAEARTARELSQAVGRLKRDLNTCNTRVDAIEEGFQSLYTAHLGNVDGLRKCKEGVLTPEDIQKLDGNLDKVNPTLVEQAKAKEDERLRHARTEKLEKQHRELIHALEEQIESLVRREKTWERTISELVARRDLLEKRENAWERTIGDLMGEIEIRTQRESWWEEMKSEMEGRIGALSQVAVVERFGPGPHFVSMMVMLEEGNPQSQREIVFQLAPLELMPHSIHLFLSQIAEGYWSRGTPAFALSAEHVLQACPHPCLNDVVMGGTVEGYPYGDMRVAGLDTVSFQEYSPKYPHEKYTIGFSGRPHSGPEFYINMLDNRLDHGTLEERRMSMNPRVFEAWAKEVLGVRSVDDIDVKSFDPYPCFGKVIKGFDVVDEIAKGMTRTSLKPDEKYAEEEYDDEDDEENEIRTLDENILLRPVRIVSVNILKDYTPPPKDDVKDKEREKESSSTTGSDEL